MKKDKMYWILEFCILAFYLIIPVALFIWKCTSIGEQEGGTKFIIGCSGYVAAFVVYIIAKKLVFKRYLAQLEGKIINYTTQIETEIDPAKITLIEKALRKCLIIKTIISVIPVIIMCGLLLLVIKALESDMVTLYAVVGFITISIGCGFVCELIQDANVKSKHRG